MQKIFNSVIIPQSYESKDAEYPKAPKKCPHKGCHIPKKMKKHGFYSRYLITTKFKGHIKVRRYRCSVCGRTVSFLPSFCIPRFAYGVEVVIGILKDLFRKGSVRSVMKKWNKVISTITRRHLTWYRKRLWGNRKFIQLILNEMSPEYVDFNNISGDIDWAKGVLLEIGQLHPHVFNADFHAIAEKSFMSLRNMIA